MKMLTKVGILAAVLAVGAGSAFAFVSAQITWGGATSINADGGVLGSDALNMPGSDDGYVCTIATPAGSMNGGVVYTPGFAQQVSNDNVNWATIDAGIALNAGNAQVSDAGPYQYTGKLLSLPFQYTRIVSTPVTAAGQLSCTFAHP